MNETPNTSNTSRLREYLLDRLTESESADIELALIADDRSFELLAAVEEELIDDYLRDALSSAEARALLAYLERLPDGRNRVRFAHALRISSLALHPEAARSLRPVATARPRFAVVLAAAALLLVSVVSATTILQLSHRVDALETELRVATNPTRSAAGSPRASFVLSSGALRAASSLPQVTVARSDEVVELRLDLAEDSHERYRATLNDADGNELVSMSRLAARVGADQVLVSFLVPAAWLAPGDYYVELEGTEPSKEGEALARFDFRAVAR